MLFEAMRQAGVRPHCGDIAEDEGLAERLVRLCRDPVDGRSGPTRPLGAPTTSGEPEAEVDPSEWFGVAEPACPWQDDHLAVGVWGRYDQVIGDLKDMGCGAIRRFKYRDVYWGSIFPDGDRKSVV